MTDETMKDLVNKHDLSIAQLIQSVDHLVTTQAETNKRLEEISSFLSKQTIIASKIETIDREIADSFKRVHLRIDEIDSIQKNDNGCNSVRLLNKDLESITKDISRLLLVVDSQRIMYESIKSEIDRGVNPAVIKWIAGLIVAYSVMFGTYVVQSFAMLEKTNARLIIKLDRDIEDTKKLTALVRTVERGQQHGKED